MAAWIADTTWIANLHTPQQDTDFLTRLIGRMDVLTLRNWRGPQGFLAREDEEVHALYLSPAARGQGNGTQLLNHAKAQSGTLRLWTFQENAGARRFYAREGFREVELTDGSGNDEKLPDARLVWAKEEARR